MSKLSWLWYLPALFIDCLITYPLLAWTVRRANRIPWNRRDDGNIILMQVVIFVIWLYPCFYLDTSNNYGTRYLLPSTLTLVCIFIFFYLFQLLISTKNGDKYAILIKLWGPLSSIALNYWKDQAPNQPLHHVLMMINYDAVFFSQGLIDQLYFKQMMRSRIRLSKTVAAPASILFFIFLYALSSPQNYQQTGFLFFYPLYSDYSIMCLYTSGTWTWIYLLTWILHAVANKKFNDIAYKLLTGSSLYAYLSHYFFIIVIAVSVIRPFQIPFIPALIVEVLLTNTIILLTYVLYVSIWELIFPPKEYPEPPSDKDKKEDEKPLLDKNNMEEEQNEQ